MGKFIVAVLNFLLTVTFPALLVLILLIIIFFFYRKKIARYLLAIVIILFYFIANGVIPQLLIRPLEANLRPISKNVILQHHTMVVLGSGITHSARYFIPGLFSYSRIVTAAKIYQIGKQNGINYTIFLSGGATSKSNLTQAELYQTALEKIGIPGKQIILENKSKNTFQNAEFTKSSLEQHHIK